MDLERRLLPFGRLYIRRIAQNVDESFQQPEKLAVPPVFDLDPSRWSGYQLGSCQSSHYFRRIMEPVS